MVALNELLPLKLRVWLLENRFICSKKARQIRHILDNPALDSIGDFTINNIESWKKRFRRMSYSLPNIAYEMAGYFFKTRIDIIKKIDINPDDVLLVCVQKNDYIKTRAMIEHHRKIGVHQFVILDNDSTDKSFEWLREQSDVFLIQSKDKYTTVLREAWVNRVFSFFGDKRWYLVVDSDELLDYEDSESKGIADVIEYMEAKSVDRVRALMIDMYGDRYYHKDGDKTTFLTQCRFFDTDTYRKMNGGCNVIQTCGGPRERIFNTSPRLTKYPLIKISEGDVELCAHYYFPYSKNLVSDCNLILRHYKFQPGEVEKYKERIRLGNYANGSIEYKAYMKVIESIQELDFFGTHTQEYVDSHSLRGINIYEPIIW